MSNNWYPSSWTGGSSGNSSSCYNNDYNQSDGYEYGGENFSNGNNFRGGYEQIYGEDARSNDRSSYRRNYEQRYGEDARSNDSLNYRENYEQRYGENVRSNDSANYSDNFGGGFKPIFGDNVRGGHCGINYTGNNTERYNDHERRTHCDWTGHYYSGGTASESDGQNKVEESYSSKQSIQDCLLEGSIVVVKQQRGRPKYQCHHCKITFFNEDHIEKKGHLGHVKHCLDVRACFEATVGKRGFGLNFKKLSSHTSEGLKSEKVKTEPYQNSYEKEYIEKDIKEESERIKHELKGDSFERDMTDKYLRIKQEVKLESFERDITNEDIRIKTEVKLELDCTQEVAAGGFKVNILKGDVDIKKELIMKTEIDIEKNKDLYEKEYIEKDIKKESDRIKHELKEDSVEGDMTDKDLRLKLEVKEESFERDMTNKDIRIKPEVKLELDCTQEVTAGGFKVNNLKDDVDLTKELKMKTEMDVEKNKDFRCNLGKVNLKQFRKSLKEKKKMKMALKNMKARERNEEKDKAIFDKEVDAVTRWDEYACLKPACLQTFQVWGDARRHMRQGCLPTTMTKKGCRLTVKPNMGQSREKAKNQRGMGTSMLKGVAAENEEKLVEAARNFYAERQNLRLYPSHTEVVWHLRRTCGGFGLPPARIHQIVNSLRKP